MRRTFRAYRNLHRGDWTIQHHIHGVGWRKYLSVPSFHAPIVDFTVGAGGRERVRREKKKNVHAFACFDHFTMKGEPTPSRWKHEYADHDTYDQSVTYNPYDDFGFRDTWGTINLTKAHDCLFDESGVIFANDVYTGENEA